MFSFDVNKISEVSETILDILQSDVKRLDLPFLCYISIGTHRLYQSLHLLRSTYLHLHLRHAVVPFFVSALAYLALFTKF